MFEYIRRGGYLIMIPLLTLSVIALGLIFERLWRYYRVPRGRRAENIIEDAETHIHTGDLKATIEFCQRKKNILTYVFIHILERFEFLVREKRSISEMRDELLVTGEENARAYLEEYVPVIYTVSTVSPLLGLLGTIIGMIQSFDALSVHGVEDPGVVAGGISKALITTAAGLIVAIPSVLAYNFFQRRVEKLLAELEPFLNMFVNSLLRDLARFRTYKEMLRTAYRDGVLNPEEKQFLKEKRVELNISEKESAELEKEVKSSLGY